MVQPVGLSAYDSLIPISIAYRPNPLPTGKSGGKKNNSLGGHSNTDNPSAESETRSGTKPAATAVMPLVQVLKEGAETKEPGWHRNEERMSRGIPPVESLGKQFETWERQLVRADDVNCICLLAF